VQCVSWLATWFSATFVSFQKLFVGGGCTGVVSHASCPDIGKLPDVHTGLAVSKQLCLTESTAVQGFGTPSRYLARTIG